MPLPTQTLDTIQRYSRAYFRSSFPGYPIGLKQFLGQVSRALGLNVWALHKSIEDIDLDIVPSPQSSRGILSAWATLLGLPNGAGTGQYGPLVPTTASGGAASLTGVQGTAYPNGTLATGPDGTTLIKVSGLVTIAGSPPGQGSVAAVLVAVTTGTVGNLPIGSVCTWQSPPAGSDPTFTLTSPLGGALDSETSAGIFGRTQTRLQTPPRGGVTTDFIFWAETVAGIVGVFAYPRRSGTGTVDVVITQGGSGTARVPSSALQTLVQAAINNLRPVACDAATVLLPTTKTGHLLRVRVAPNGTVNAFDWGADALGTAYTVSSYSAGPPATITLTGPPPASLIAAVLAYIAGTGAQPRLQVLSTGSVINVPVGTSKTVAISGNVITLDSLPGAWIAPTGGDTVYPYGPVVPTIAAGLLALVDGLGPSRVNSFADPFNTWNDTISIGQMARVAEDAVDGNGTVLVTEVLAGGATIDGSATDVEGVDNTSSPPELLYTSHVAVTQ